MTYAIHPLHEEETTIAAWLMRSEHLHRSLRTSLPPGYAAYMRLMFSEGARMAVLHEAEVPKALAVYRIQHTTFHGRRFYIDDLVTVESGRGRGYGSALLQWCDGEARAQSCDTFALDSGVQRGGAHRFYFSRGLTITSFGFARPLP